MYFYIEYKAIVWFFGIYMVFSIIFKIYRKVYSFFNLTKLHLTTNYKTLLIMHIYF